jgi:hypothetical protein
MLSSFGGCRHTMGAPRAAAHSVVEVGVFCFDTTRPGIAQGALTYRMSSIFAVWILVRT